MTDIQHHRNRTLEAASNGVITPIGYTVGRDPRSGQWGVRRRGRLAAWAPTRLEAVSLSWELARDMPDPTPRIDEDTDPGPGRWEDDPIRRVLRKAREEAQG